MKPNSKLLATIEVDGNLVQQFTPEGLEVLVEYYNQKYPERGQINHVASVMNLDLRNVEEAGEQKNQRTLHEIVSDATSKMQKLQESSPHSPVKIMFTIGQKRNADEEPAIATNHSNPLLLTADKLILLRDENEPFGVQMLLKIAQGLGVKLIQQIEIDPNAPKLPREQRISIQGDHTSCNGIAVGILKDLTSDDLQKVSAFENGYKPLPKMLKYSQSDRRLQKDLDLIDAPVKDSGETLKQYKEKHTSKTDGVFTTRIGTKLEKVKQDMSEIPGADGDAKSFAKVILQERLARKQKPEIERE